MIIYALVIGCCGFGIVDVTSIFIKPKAIFSGKVFEREIFTEEGIFVSIFNVVASEMVLTDEMVRMVIGEMVLEEAEVVRVAILGGEK
jgi:hypothetical protein